MEDFSPTPAEVEETPIKRRRFLRGNFLSSWLEHRDDDDDDETSDKPKKKSRAQAEATAEEPDWLPERWRDRFKTFFKGLVSLEIIPAEAAKDAEDRADDTETADVAILERLPQPEATNSGPTLEEEGLLAVSADAQLRYYGYELPDEDDGEEVEPEVEVDEVETEQPIEQYRVPSVTETQAHQPAAVEQRSGNTEPVGDVLQRRQAERLEKKVKKLKKKTKSLKHEQDEINKKQKDFAKELDKQQQAQERFEKVTVPKMERDRQQLHKRLETAPTTAKQEFPERRATLPETQQKPQVKSEFVPRPERVEAAPKLEQPTRAELQPTATDHEKLSRIFEAPAKETSLRESDLERRHEVKDEPGSDKDGSTASPSGPMGANQPIPSVPPPFMAPQPTGNIPPVPTGPMPPPKPVKPDNLYRQAAVTGAVSGVGLTIIVILVLLLMRS